MSYGLAKNLPKRVIHRVLKHVKPQRIRMPRHFFDVVRFAFVFWAVGQG